MQILAILLWWDAISFIMLSRIHIKWEGPKNNKKLYKYMDGNLFLEDAKNEINFMQVFFPLDLFNFLQRHRVSF